MRNVELFPKLGVNFLIDNNNLSGIYSGTKYKFCENIIKIGPLDLRLPWFHTKTKTS